MDAELAPSHKIRKTAKFTQHSMTLVRYCLLTYFDYDSAKSRFIFREAISNCI